MSERQRVTNADILRLLTSMSERLDRLVERQVALDARLEAMERSVQQNRADLDHLHEAIFGAAGNGYDRGGIAADLVALRREWEEFRRFVQRATWTVLAALLAGLGAWLAKRILGTPQPLGMRGGGHLAAAWAMPRGGGSTLADIGTAAGILMLIVAAGIFAWVAWDWWQQRRGR